MPETSHLTNIGTDERPTWRYDGRVAHQDTQSRSLSTAVAQGCETNRRPSILRLSEAENSQLSGLWQRRSAEADLPLGDFKKRWFIRARYEATESRQILLDLSMEDMLSTDAFGTLLPGSIQGPGDIRWLRWASFVDTKRLEALTTEVLDYYDDESDGMAEGQSMTVDWRPDHTVEAIHQSRAQHERGASEYPMGLTDPGAQIYLLNYHGRIIYHTETLEYAVTQSRRRSLSEISAMIPEGLQEEVDSVLKMLAPEDCESNTWERQTRARVKKATLCELLRTHERLLDMPLRVMAGTGVYGRCRKGEWEPQEWLAWARMVDAEVFTRGLPSDAPAGADVDDQRAEELDITEATGVDSMDSDGSLGSADTAAGLRDEDGASVFSESLSDDHWIKAYLLNYQGRIVHTTQILEEAVRKSRRLSQPQIYAMVPKERHGELSKELKRLAPTDSESKSWDRETRSRVERTTLLELAKTHVRLQDMPFRVMTRTRAYGRCRKGNWEPEEWKAWARMVDAKVFTSEGPGTEMRHPSAPTNNTAAQIGSPVADGHERHLSDADLMDVPQGFMPAGHILGPRVDQADELRDEDWAEILRELIPATPVPGDGLAPQEEGEEGLRDSDAVSS
ncbi:uncharacterized protein MKK02DRAFT_33925 [Dioszegia hungarica]|uniref:Uncharacterized protein n=1 Tax=Dioszegia hungarica TaxID=4972 RepID=A0AA38LTG0_9TREE|nr:uncharacterized protein MKK02DRAFT_33925 [Dioszegia hungarica]KAI9636822.1 hypothetical protein MKK02DRAFT_33925 [Dioszegia hungarica]